jgi:hypothetical protein
LQLIELISKKKTAPSVDIKLGARLAELSFWISFSSQNMFDEFGSFPVNKENVEVALFNNFKSDKNKFRRADKTEQNVVGSIVLVKTFSCGLFR